MHLHVAGSQFEVLRMATDEIGRGHYMNQSPRGLAAAAVTGGHRMQGTPRLTGYMNNCQLCAVES